MQVEGNKTEALLPLTYLTSIAAIVPEGYEEVMKKPWEFDVDHSMLRLVRLGVFSIAPLCQRQVHEYSEEERRGAPPHLLFI